MKRLFLTLVFVVVSGMTLVAATPAYDAGTSITGTDTEFTGTHTATGSDLFIFIDVGYNPTTVDPVTFASYDGQTLTKLAFRENGTDQGVATFYGTGISTGANPVTILLAASTKCTIAVRTYTGVDQITPVHTNIHADVTGTSGAVTITTTEADALVIGCAAWEGSGVITVGSGQTERVTMQVSGGSPSTRTTFAGDDEGMATPGQVEMAYSYTIGNEAVLCAVEIHQPAGAASPTPTSTVTPSPTPGRRVFMNPLMAGVPLFSVNPDTVALLRFENNMRDEVGKYDWTLYGAADFTSTRFVENLYGIGEFDSAVSVTTRIESPTITEQIKTIEFWCYVDWDVIGANQYLYATESHDFLVQLNAGIIRFAIAVGGWSDSIGVADDTWIYAAWTFDGVDGTQFIDNVNTTSVASTYIPQNEVHVLGNYFPDGPNFSCDCWLDYFRLSSVVRTNFPTSD